MSYAGKSTPELFEILFSGEYEDPHGDLQEEGPSEARSSRVAATPGSS
jgi:hypothetical protein